MWSNMRLSRYGQGMVVTKHNKCAIFLNGLQYGLMIQVTLHQERVFETSMEKTKIVKEVMRVEYERREKAKATSNRDIGPTITSSRPIKRARYDRPRQNTMVVSTGGRTQNSKLFLQW